MYTITITGFNSKQEVLEWVKQYQGGNEQYFDPEAGSVPFPTDTNTEHYIEEVKKFSSDSQKTDFNLDLCPYIAVYYEE